MWVVFCDQTGVEVDRVESREERDELVAIMDEDNEWKGYTYSYRWED